MTNQIYVYNGSYAVVTKETDDVMVLRTYALRGKFFINIVSMSKKEFENKYRKATVEETVVFCKNVNQCCLVR